MLLLRLAKSEDIEFGHSLPAVIMDFNLQVAGVVTQFCPFLVSVAPCGDLHFMRPVLIGPSHDGTRVPTEMHIADAERVVREFPHEWSRFPSATAEPAPVAQPTALDRLGDLERDLRDLQARLAATRREVAGTGRGN